MTPGSLSPARVLKLAAARYPDRRALRFEDRECTYGELDEAVERVAHGLAALGVAAGDRLATRSYNSDQMLIMMFAAARLGAVVVPLNTMLTDDDVTDMVRRSEATVFCYGPGFGVAGSALRQRLETISTYVALEAEATDGAEREPGPAWVGTSMAALRRSAPAAPLPVVDDEQPAMVIFTSGSSGTPKGVVKSFANVTWSAINRQLAEPRSAASTELYTIPLTGVGFANFVVTAVLAGAPLVLVRQFDAARVAELLNAELVTHTFLAPTMIAAVLAQAPGTTFDTVEVVETAYEMPLALRQAAVNGFPRARFKYGYGMTEGAMSSCPSELFLRSLSAVGFGSGLDEFRVVRADGSLAAADEVGEIEIAGPTVMTGYLGETDSAFTADGWLRSGDLGAVDAAGVLHFRGRLKDMIKTGGYNVAAAEVEQAIVEDARVADVAVVGLPHPYWGEAVVAFVVPVPGVDPGLADELGATMEQRLAGFMRPKRFVLTAALPLNPGGKVAKGQLRATHAEMFADGAP